VFQKIREERGLAYSVYTYLTRFSNCGLLSVYVGTTKEDYKEVIKLIKEEDRFSKELLTADEYIQKEQKRHNESIERHFGLKYVELENKTNITWDDLKAYLIHSGYNYTGLNTNDEQAFDNFKRGKVNENYQGSFDDFKGLSPAERDKVVKDFLKRYKNEEAFVAGLAENLPTTEFVTQLKNHKLKMSTIYYMGSFEDKTYQYTLEVKNADPLFPNGYAIKAKSFYDSQKEWYEQNGSYECDFRRLHASKYNNELYINLTVMQSSAGHAIGCPIMTSSANSFELRGEYNPLRGKKIKCTVNDTKDEKLTLNITIDIPNVAGTYTFKFEPASLF